MSNKSKTYVYPIFHRQLGLTLPYNLEETYSYDHTQEDVFILVYEFNETSSAREMNNFLFLNNSFSRSGLIKDIKRSEDNTRIAYILNIPENLQEHFDKFKKGLYSTFSDKEKYTIVQFLQKYYSTFPKAIENITSILFNNPEYRKEMSTNFGYNIPENIELSSKPNIESETFAEELLNININQYAI